MDTIGRLLGFLAYCAASVMVVVMLVSIIPVTEREYTARYTAGQQEETRRVQAQEETERVQAEQWNQTLQQWAWPTAAAVILVVVAIQAGRTTRQWQSERTKRQALLVWYMGHMLPPGARAEIGTWRGDLAIIDHDSGEIIPYAVAQLEAPAYALLEDRRNI